MPSLDVTYISAFTWYFVILIGSNGLLALLQSIAGSKAPRSFTRSCGSFLLFALPDAQRRPHPEL